ncbi:MAG TPA: PD-(D/E)XK nuclease family protein [Bryobacteraceae bacterium]|nr:PD-(D/E)XK nuclease family protein [Bryobacteraceae bacterium]
MARIERLASDWNSGRQAREVAAEADRDRFCERAQCLFDDVSGVLWRSTSWDPFDVLGRPRLEDAHSRMIAWLMNPTKPHGLKDGFLRAFFEKAFHVAMPAGGLESRVTVKKRIGSGEVDIEVKGPGWWLIVENKIDAKEDLGQTRKYAAHYERFAKLRERFFPVFLSREGKRPESSDFATMSYRDLRDVLESVRPAPEAEQFVQQFIQHILCHLEI